METPSIHEKGTVQPEPTGEPRQPPEFGASPRATLATPEWELGRHELQDDDPAALRSGPEPGNGTGLPLAQGQRRGDTPATRRPGAEKRRSLVLRRAGGIPGASPADRRGPGVPGRRGRRRTGRRGPGPPPGGPLPPRRRHWGNLRPTGPAPGSRQGHWAVPGAEAAAPR